MDDPMYGPGDLNADSVKLLDLVADAQDATRVNDPPWLSQEVADALAHVGTLIEDIDLERALAEVKRPTGSPLVAHQRLRTVAAARWLVGAITSEDFVAAIASRYLWMREPPTSN